MRKFEKPTSIRVDEYYPSMSRRKGLRGTVTGTLTSVIAVGITGLVKGFIDVDPDVENVIAGISGLIAGGLTLGLGRLIGNSRKHRHKVKRI